MNLDFSAEPLFSWYVVLLAVSGIAMVVLGAVSGSLSGGWRAVNVIAGLAFAGYAYYLAFVFEGGEYRLFFQAFILPVVLIANSVKALMARSAPAPQPVPSAVPYNPNAPYQGTAPYQGAVPYNPNAPQGAQPVPPQAAAQPPAPQQPSV
ncbi:hypothetical protein RMN57_16200 [Kitasatospora sp. CM 4170]|uniref:Integral membrane protein n=1 Tax=Kitasatospora aburaviensis TaxID=67265 RepID=A0ABW1F0G1_9ACTN|nr:hypothetical protein [Kitasatospora sp. CM 4170]WNM46132.1 hypothetical protein RMN57_16200 [Kitasatospora sp. CM 4170]